MLFNDFLLLIFYVSGHLIPLNFVELLH
jgi:hypothetical protein